MSTPFLTHIDELVAVTRGDTGDGFDAALRGAWKHAQSAGPDELTTGIERLAPILGGLHGTYAQGAVLAGALVEHGGSPLSLAEKLPGRVAMAIELLATFPRIWAEAGGGQPLPDPAADASVMEEVHTKVLEFARERGIREQLGSYVALAWFDVDSWMNVMITVLARREFRAAVPAPERDRVRAAAAVVAPRVPRANWLLGLALVLDDEPLVVLDPRSGRGFQLTMSGVTDNFQLHTLLADRLIGPGLLDGERPDDDWVLAATTGVPGPFPGAEAIRRRFRLFDAHGAYVYPEGRPADIEPLDGTRVAVLHPPLGDFGWINGRLYADVTPEFVLDRELTADEASEWLGRVAPARETDIMGMNP